MYLSWDDIVGLCTDWSKGLPTKCPIVVAIWTLSSKFISGMIPVWSRSRFPMESASRTGADRAGQRRTLMIVGLPTIPNNGIH